MTSVVCCIDVGTTNTKAALVGEEGTWVASASQPTPGEGVAPRDLAVDPEGLLGTVGQLVGALLRQCEASPPAVEAICVTTQRGTVILRDAAGAVQVALSWQDPRSNPERAELAAELEEARFQAITGLPHSTMWVLTKSRWLRRHRPAIAEAARRYSLIHDDLLVQLGAEQPLIDPSNASPTGLWDLRRGRWCPELLERAGVGIEALPAVVQAGSRAGALSRGSAAACGLPAGTPLIVGGGDQPCATLGMGVLGPGTAGVCLGTAADVTSVMAGCPDLEPGQICTPHVVAGQVLLEGFLSCFGAALQWADAAIAPRGPVPGDGDPRDAPFFLPFLSGVATPDFDPAWRGALLGLGAHHGPAEILAAVWEGLAFELRRILDSGAVAPEVSELRVAGGLADNDPLLQALADHTGRRLQRVEEAEVSLLGAACLAWTGVARYPDPIAAAGSFHRVRVTGVEPRSDPEVVAARYRRYGRLVDAVQRAPRRDPAP